MIKLRFDMFDLVLIETQNDGNEIIIWKKTNLTKEDITLISELKNIAENNKDAILNFKNKNTVLADMAQLKIDKSPKEKININIKNESEAYISIASQLL